MGFLGFVDQAVQLFNSAAERRNAQRLTDKTIAANKQLAEYQYSKDVEMWNRGNVYNSPTAQMERLKAAGLNPNMVYGSGNAPGMSAGQLPKYNAPTVDYTHIPAVQLPQVLSMYQDFEVKAAQIDALRSQAQVKSVEAQYAPDVNRYKRNLLYQRQGAGAHAADIAGSRASYEHWKAMNEFERYGILKEYGSDIKQQQLRNLRQQELVGVSNYWKNRYQTTSIDQNIELLRKQNQWFVTRMFADLIGKTLQGAGTLNRFKR